MASQKTAVHFDMSVDVPLLGALRHSARKERKLSVVTSPFVAPRTPARMGFHQSQLGNNSGIALRTTGAN